MSAFEPLAGNERTRAYRDKWPAIKCVPGVMTLEDAQAMRSCRICGQPLTDNDPDNPRVTNYGGEYAHQKCLKEQLAGRRPKDY
ncbi:MAG: hypothetical protein ABSH20_18090 [Tepidisphaeraceae bacterium]